ncbi:MAG TPA: hypothetical protein VNE39_12400 [Planctomycetota bacterium]|nr:hypothetical protein [Planctomycetota bacterium]
MPPSLGGHWAVARFQVDDMYSNDTHLRVNDPRQQYERFYFTLNGDLRPDSFFELGWVIVWRGKDAEPPSAPARFTIEREGDNVLFRWTPSTDNLMVRYYELLRVEGGGLKPVTLATSNHLELAAAQCPPGDYAIRAIDVADNASPPSEKVERR